MYNASRSTEEGAEISVDHSFWRCLLRSINAIFLLQKDEQCHECIRGIPCILYVYGYGQLY
jgi:hypothetical protein